MTLIANEIYLIDGAEKTFIVSYADRQLTYRDEKNPKKKYTKGKKLFKIEHLNSTVSFWGATLVKKGNNYELMCSWLPNFIRKNSSSTLKEFANTLKDELNKVTDKQQLKKEPSGFHLAGINKDGIPEFIHFSNCSHNPVTGRYDDLQDSFKNPFEDFLERDAKRYGWNGKDRDSIIAKNIIQSYRNGDILVHAAAWTSLDNIFSNLIKQSNFSRLRNLSDKSINKLIRHKLDFISSIYSNWAEIKLVAGPWDLVIIHHNH